MTDAEISRRLALAIGWDVLPVSAGDDGVMVVDHKHLVDRYFDYRDPAVIWPIAERFDCFPNIWNGKGPEAWMAWCENEVCWIKADTAAKAVALAVIKSKESK